MTYDFVSCDYLLKMEPFLTDATEPNGLIKSELWIDDIKDQVFYFISTYEFY